LSYVLIVCTVPLPPGVNPIAVDKYINIKNSAREGGVFVSLTHRPSLPTGNVPVTHFH